MFEKIFIIAEVGSNHNGDLDTAVELVLKAAEAGVDAVKFQSFTLTTLVEPYQYEKTLRIKNGAWRDAISRSSFRPEWLPKLAEVARKAGISLFSTPFYPEAVDILDEYVSFYKIASGDITYIPLLKKVAEKGKGVFLSTGASKISEIDRAVRLLESYRLPFICIMHCVMLYPPEPENLHLNFIDTLKKHYKHPVGFSDHTRGFEAALVATGKGIRALEKHLTLDRKQDGYDHKNSLEPSELKELVERIRRCELMLGKTTRPLSGREAKERIYARRGIYARESLKKGDVITIDKLAFLRPNTSIGAEEVEFILGRTLAKDVEAGTPLENTMFEPHF
jgi:sialic acid synthase SpsE